MLAATNRILTPGGYELISDIVTGAAIFAASTIDPDVTRKVSIPQSSAMQETNLVTMEDGSTIEANEATELLVYTDYDNNVTAYKAITDIIAGDKVVRVLSNARDNLDVYNTPQDSPKRMFDYAVVQSNDLVEDAMMMAVLSTVYKFAAFAVPFDGLVVNGFVVKLNGTLINTFLAADDTPTIGATTVLTLTLFAPAPAPAHPEQFGGGGLFFAVAYENGDITGPTNLHVPADSLTGTITVTAVGGTQCDVTASGFGESVVEGLDAA